MSNQYLLRLRKTPFYYEEEGFTKRIHSRLLTEGGETIFNRFYWNSSRSAALAMDEMSHSLRQETTLDDRDETRWSTTINNNDRPEVGGRVRLYSESQVHTVSRWEDNEVQDEESGGGADGAPFRGRSQSAPAALWKAKKYGRQLRRMSDEFDTWLDKGEMRRVSSPGRVAQRQTNRGWFSFLWTTKEEEGRE
ncbi:uncharacterized protein bada [Trichomycterus rosablanca]|uniref:uncharacterized protein bada n=1 Tax=Trichomycterus rosablanca TaxID=2290929 RepID=UPI002F35427C